MSRPFDFSAWLAATGWSAPVAAAAIHRDPKTVLRMKNGKHPVSQEVEALCREATRQQIERLQPFVA